MTNEELILLAKSGDMDAYNQLFRQNKRLITKIAKERYNGVIEWNELISLVWMGAFKAYLRFDPTRKIKFNTFVGVCAQTEIGQYLQARNTKKRSAEVIPLEFISEEEGTNERIGYDDQGYDDVIDRVLLSEVNTYCNELDDIKRLIYYNSIIGDIPLEWVARQLKVSRSYTRRIRKNLIQEIRPLVEGLRA